MEQFDRQGVAARIRDLLGPVVDPELWAIRLDVSELALRMSVDDVSPHPTFEVMVAVIRELGVDPTWLVTGSYDKRTHRRVLENAAEAPIALHEIAFQMAMPRGRQTQDPQPGV